MEDFRAALSWSGTSAMVSLFMLSSRDPAPQFDPSALPGTPRLQVYELDDESRVLGGLRVYEYDLIWAELPSDLEGAVQTVLEWSLAAGAPLAWCAFEASLDFEYLLHPDVATQVYAVAAGEAVRLALDDGFRASEEWKHLLVDLRQLLP